MAWPVRCAAIRRRDSVRTPRVIAGQSPLREEVRLRAAVHQDAARTCGYREVHGPLTHVLPRGAACRPGTSHAPRRIERPWAGTCNRRPVQRTVSRDVYATRTRCSRRRSRPSPERQVRETAAHTPGPRPTRWRNTRAICRRERKQAIGLWQGCSRTRSPALPSSRGPRPPRAAGSSRPLQSPGSPRHTRAASSWDATIRV